MVEEIARRSGDFALAGVVAAVELDDAGAVERSAIGFLGMAPTPMRARAAEAGAQRHSPTAPELAEIGRLAVGDTDPTADVHASAEYRTHVGAHLVQRVRSIEHWEKRGVAEQEITLTVNGERRPGRAEPRKTLADFLREDLALTGTHLGCEHGVCGACTCSSTARPSARA